MPKAEWEKFEEDVQNLLGLDATICSGNKFHDQGDAVDRSHPSRKCWRLMVDCKYTEKGSFPVTAKFMGGMVDKATELGLRFALAVRLRPPGSLAHRDYVVIPLDDLAELLDRADPPVNLVDRTWSDLDDYRRGY
jgi:hypothetical protein